MNTKKLFDYFVKGHLLGLVILLMLNPLRSQTFWVLQLTVMLTYLGVYLYIIKNEKN
jgi:uncharacterized membrane protein